MVLAPAVPALSAGDCLAIVPGTAFDVLGRPNFYACCVADGEIFGECEPVVVAAEPGTCATTYDLAGQVVP